MAGNSRRKENIMEKFDIDFFKGLFNYLEVSPRLTGDKLLLKGWCHGSE